MHRGDHGLFHYGELGAIVRFRAGGDLEGQHGGTGLVAAGMDLCDLEFLRSVSIQHAGCAQLAIDCMKASGFGACLAGSGGLALLRGASWEVTNWPSQRFDCAYALV